jgi:plastocyanin
MKKVYASLVFLLILKSTFAATHIVQVSNFQFSPATVNAVVGDVIEWTWVSGFHNTNSTSVPPGASPWVEQPIQSAGQTYSYTVTVAGTYTYDCTIHPTQMLGTIVVTGALPVVLNDFSVSATKAMGALLAWVTASEQNTDHFEIMRSTNGIHFEKIATVPAKGNSSVLVNYSYTDNALPANVRYLYYSLAIVDKDGKRSLSDIKIFSNINGSTKLIVSLSPNPISRPGHLMLQFNSDKDNSMHVQLFDQSGKLVKQVDMSAVAGLNNGHFHIGEVAPGVYTIIFTMDDKKESYKIVVQ